jgi:hypothetical protein
MKNPSLLLVIILLLSARAASSQTFASDFVQTGHAADRRDHEFPATPDQRLGRFGAADNRLAGRSLSIRFNWDGPGLRPRAGDFFYAANFFTTRRLSGPSVLLHQLDGRFPSFAIPPAAAWQFSAMPTHDQKDFSPFLKWLGQGAFWWAAFFDHYQDAIQDAPDHQSHIFNANYRHWHLIKNLAHLGYLTTGFAAGMELGRKQVTPRRLVLRMAGSVLIYWFIQNIVYDKSLYNDWFDYERKHTKDGVVIFDLRGRDHRIELSKWARPLLDVVRVAGGMYLVIKY